MCRLVDDLLRIGVCTFEADQTIGGHIGLGLRHECLRFVHLRLFFEHDRHRFLPVRFDSRLDGLRDRDDASVVGCGKPEDVAKLAFGGDHVRGAGDQVEIELFEPLSCSGDIGDGTAADDELGLLAVQDFPGQPDGQVRAPELDVCVGEVPILLLDRADVGHDLSLELLHIDARVVWRDLGRRSGPPYGNDANFIGILQANADRLGES